MIIDRNKSIALVTGGGGDIGRAIALRLALVSAAVAIVDLDEPGGKETAAQIEASGCRAHFIRADVSDSRDSAAYVEAVERTLGPIGVFVNNAGVVGTIAPLPIYSEEMFDRLMRVNTKGVFLGMKHVLARMIPRGTGAIVNMASTSAIRGRAGLAGYVASKHAVLGLTRVAALDTAGTKIRVNAVLPGPVHSRMVEDLEQQSGADRLRWAGGASFGRPADVARIVAFLASDDATHVNGAAWVVDGSMTVA